MTTDSILVEPRRRLWRSRWAAVGAAVAVTFGGGGLFAVSAASPESSVVTLEPVRILDSRDPVNVGLAGPFVSPVAQDLKVTGSVPTTTGTKTVVPTGATGVFLNVTPVGSTAAGFISVRAANATGLPSTSNVNFEVGAINPNAVLVELPVGGADDGKIEITFDAFGAAGPTTDVLVDIVGYTTDAKLQALEAGLATKANAADVYTKSEIDASTANALRVAGGVDSSGAVYADAPQIGLAYTSSRLAAGQYKVSIPGLQAGCVDGVTGSFPVVTATALGATAVLEGLGLNCPSGDSTFEVWTFDPVTGAEKDATFLFDLYTDYSQP